MSLMSRIGTPSTTTTSTVPFDLVYLGFILALLLLSLFSLGFVLRLRFHKPHTAPSSSHHPLHRNFNSLWTVRLLLVSLISLWSLSHLLPLVPFLLPHPHRHNHHQPSLCKLHLVLSLGFLQPAFLITILYLLNASVNKPRSGAASAVAVVLFASLPTLFLQILSSYSPTRLPVLEGVLNRSSVLYRDDSGYELVLCSYPIVGTLIFTAFGASFLFCFLASCWRVVSVAINKGLRVRIYMLALAISASLTTEILFLGISSMWLPGDSRRTAAMLVVFLAALSCAVAGEGMLVIRPIADALVAGGGECYGQLSMDDHRYQTPEVVVLDGDHDGSSSHRRVRETSPASTAALERRISCCIFDEN